MKRISIAVMSVAVLSSFSVHALDVDSKLGQVESRCKAVKPKKNVLLFKQWHLPPSETTFPAPTKVLQQAGNQISIYDQLEKWIAGGKLKTVLGEGCFTEMNASFKEKFNGWSFEELKKASTKSNYNRVLSHVPLKLEAKFGDAVLTRCADDPEQIKIQSLAFSDARGSVGFLSRMDQFRTSPEKLKPYLDTAIPLLKMPAKSSAEEVTARLNEDLRAAVSKVKAGFEIRNEKFVQAIKSLPDGDIALVIGGGHIPDLVARLEKSGIGCQVIRPRGYTDEEDHIVEDFSNMADKL